MIERAISDELRQVYSFMESVYSANWVLRWKEAPYMDAFADSQDIERLGKFETVPGHVWGAILLGTQIKRIGNNLRKVVVFEEVYERLVDHDIGESRGGDISAASTILGDAVLDKQGEKEVYIEIVDSLPKDEATRLTKWFDEFEGEPDEDTPLEALVARWIDRLQGDHFALTFGNNLPEYSKTIETIIKKYSILRSRELINALESREQEVYKSAAKEVEEITRTHISLIKEAGIKVDLSELGF